MAIGGYSNTIYSSQAKQAYDVDIKVKKKFSFRQMVRNWLADYPNDLAACQPVEAIRSTEIQSDGMKFQLYKAAGGYVIETTRIDRLKDRMNHSLYIIKNDDDLGQELAKIITMESLRG